MTLIEKARYEMLNLKEKSKFEKMLLFTSILTELLEEYDIKPIIVGGFSVEIYTRSRYTTADIDLVLSGRDKANGVLLELGFEKLGKDWFHEDLEIAIEIPDNVLDGNHDKVIELNLQNNKKVYVIGIDDIIADRLRACVHWKSSEDCEWGYRLFFIHQDGIDLDYLKQKSEKDKTSEELNKWIETYKKSHLS